MIAYLLSIFHSLSYLILLLFVLAYFVRRANIKHLEHIPGPPTNNIFLGNSSELRDPITRVETIRKWRNTYGPVFKITGGIFTHSEVVLVDPDVENIIMRIPNKGNGFWPFKWFMKYIARTEAVFILDGKEWEVRRKEIVHQGFMFKDLPGNFEVIDANLRKIKHLLESKQTTTDIHQLASVVLIDSMAESLFGNPIGVIENPNHVLVSTFERFVKEMAIVQNFPLHFFKPSTLKLMIKIREYLFSAKNEVTDRFTNPEKYESCQDVCSKAVMNGVLDQKSIMAELAGALLAASGNPSLTITWLLYTLIQNPEILRKLEAELVEVVGNKSEPDFEDIKKMKYLDHVVQETFRMFIPDAIHRCTDEDITLHGYSIPKNSQIWIPSFLSHFEKVGEEPYRFNPDRFADSETPIKIHPFGGGPRICLGHMWTKLAVKVIVSNVVHNFHMKLDENNNKNGEEIVPEFHMLLFESAKIKFHFERKENRGEKMVPERHLLNVSLNAEM